LLSQDGIVAVGGDSGKKIVLLQPYIPIGSVGGSDKLFHPDGLSIPAIFAKYAILFFDISPYVTGMQRRRAFSSVTWQATAVWWRLEEGRKERSLVGKKEMYMQGRGT
jgi:hypothetical protein